jgi:hypothetical protein
MNTNQINAKKELFIRAMEKDNKDLIHAVAPAEMMTIIHKCDPLHHHNGENHLLEISNADELCFDDYCFDNHCGESDYMERQDNCYFRTYIADRHTQEAECQNNTGKIFRQDEAGVQPKIHIHSGTYFIGSTYDLRYGDTPDQHQAEKQAG